MKLIDALSKLQQFSQPILTTNDIAAILSVPCSHASQIGRRLHEANMISKLKHNLWLIFSIDHFAIPAALSAPFPCYISLLSALYHHGIIGQIPTVLYAITIARTRTYHTSLGAISLHHIHSDLFEGYDIDDETGVLIATPEKALVDYIYFSRTRSPAFHQLPEIELADNFNYSYALKLIENIPSIQQRNYALKIFKSIT